MRDPAGIKKFDAEVRSALEALTEAAKPVNAKGAPLMTLATFKTKLSAAIAEAEKTPEVKHLLAKMADMKKQAAELSKEFDELVSAIGQAKADALADNAELLAAAKKTGSQAKTLITQRKNEWINNPYGEAGDGRGEYDSKYSNPFAKGR
jgi:peptide subunit release factor RF-3